MTLTVDKFQRAGESRREQETVSMQLQSVKQNNLKRMFSIIF